MLSQWQFFGSAWQVVSAALVLLAGIAVAKVLSKTFHGSTRRALLLYCWHTVFCVYYAYFLLDNVGDATAYYYQAVQGNITFSLGTAAVELITYFCVSIFGLSFLGTFLVYNIFGFIGIMAFDGSLRIATADKSKWVRRLATLIILLPSVSFWSSAIGKDAIAFMATSLALWAALHLKDRVWLMVTAVLLMLIVRPHIAGIMILALAGSQLIQRNIPFSRRVILGGAAALAATIMVPIALEYTGVGADVSAAELVSYVEQRQQMNHDGGSSIDIASMGVPMQLFTYLFRPLPMEANSLFSLAASADNVILLFLFIVGVWNMLIRRKRPLAGNRAFLWLFSLLSWFILASTTANLGLAVRQKWMFAPILLFLLISLLGKTKSRYLSR
ncbi:hypothetical protein ACMHYO_13990 [Allopusillimonas ginsengisoli]|uniref:hypothetical protein n=1 Tax=Allopusillimonas ginsengisoli TaxID=453575 RepID=UPI0039C1C441